MEYGVSTGLQLPTGSPELDPLQAEGSASVLDRLPDQVGGADGEDGTEVSVTRFWIGAHPEGTLVLLVLEADSLEIAEAAPRDIKTEIQDHSELLADWIIARCGVGLDERFAEAGLHAADGPDAPPADPTARTRWLVTQSNPHTAQGALRSPARVP
jgi:hypothetical protein